jgi:integrase
MENTLTLVPSPTLTYLTEIERDPRLKSAHTRRQYKAALGTFEAWRGDRPLTKTLVEEYASELQRAGKSPNTINQALAVVRWWARRVTDLAFEQAPREQAEQISQQAQRVIGVHDVKGSRTIRGRHVEIAELTQLLGACMSDTSPAGVRDAAMIGLAIHTATRNEELRAVTIADITFTQSGADIKIQHGKGDKARDTHIDGETLAALNAWIELRGVGKGPVFCPIRKNGNIAAGLPISYEGTRIILYKRFIQSALSKTITWHDFRRTVVGMMFDNGVDPSTIQQVGGWADPKTVQRYDRRPADRRKEALKGISIPYKSVE